MSENIVFLDSETTSLAPHRRAWEVCAITYPADEASSWMVRVADLDLSNADIDALRVGGFYERHPNMTPPYLGIAHTEEEMLTALERLTRDATIVGANPRFDMDTLERRMRAHGLLPSWHYRPRCITSIVSGQVRRDVGGLRDAATAAGIDPGTYRLHTAYGDAQLVRSLWLEVMTG